MPVNMPVESIDEKKSSSGDINMHELHGSIINYSSNQSFHHLKRRVDLLDKKHYAQVDSLINGIMRKDSKRIPTEEITCDNSLFFLPNSFKEFNLKNSVSGKNEYQLLVFGTFQDGRKAAICLGGFKPYFELKCPAGEQYTSFYKRVREAALETCGDVKISTLQRKGFRRHEFGKSRYIRFEFNTAWERKKTLEMFVGKWEYRQSKKVLTNPGMGLAHLATSDDDNHFERVMCRNHDFTLSMWNVIHHATKFAPLDGCKLKKVLYLNANDLAKFEGDTVMDARLCKDKTMVETWDIEAYTNSGDMPNPSKKNDKVFAIGHTYHWATSSESILDVCLVSRPCNARPDKLTVYCKNEKDLIKAFADIHEIMQPEFTTGFNDGDFDWKFIITKAIRYDCLQYLRDKRTMFIQKRIDYRTKQCVSKRDDIDSIIKWDTRMVFTKIDAETSVGSKTLKTIGVTNIDTRTMLRKTIKPTPKSSLNYYLTRLNLANKEDMPIHYMFGIYKKSVDIEKGMSYYTSNDKPIPDKLQKMFEENKELMADVAHYCTIDARRCHDLLLKTNIISGCREVSGVSHTTVFDAIYYADGMKVRNLIIAEGQKIGILFHTKANHKNYILGKYPGAHVFYPKKGLVRPKLTVRERKESNPKWSSVSDADLNTMEKAVREQRYESKYSGEELRTLVDAHKFNEQARVKDLTDSTVGKFESKTSQHLFEEFAEEETHYPISGLDFSSLYPSIIMTYNLSPEFMICYNDYFDTNPQRDTDRAEAHAERARAEGHTLHKIEVDCREKEFKDKYGKKIKGAHRVFKFQGYSIRHDTTDGHTLQEGKTECKFGLYPTILKNLFDKRKAMKDLNKVREHKLEIMEKDGLCNTPEYITLMFKFDQANIKQKALKVFMNTFYGETGNKNSPFFILQIAGGITTAGQRNIKMVADLVQRLGCDYPGKRGDVNPNGCRLYYGDTDSCYISCPEIYFLPLNQQYYGGCITKEAYCIALVEGTFKQIKIINKIANDHLVKDNGTYFLRLAYEEVLYYAIFLLKKMYAGVQHRKIVNFHPDVENLFVKGLSIAKRGTSEVLKTVGTEVLAKAVSIDNLLDVKTIVLDKIKEVYTRKWTLADFKKTAVYKPNKNNVPVKRFVERMIERGNPTYPPPEPVERFEYVVVKTFPFVYDLKGNKKSLGMGDKWEYYTYALEHNLEIDLDYYISKGITGALAQFIAYHPDFITIPDDSSIDAYDTSEKKTLLKARKFIETLCKVYANVPVCHGVVVKELFKIANNRYKDVFKTACVNTNDGNTAEKVKLLAYSHLTTGSVYQYMMTSIAKQSEKASSYYADHFLNHMTKKYTKKVIYPLLKAYTTAESPLLAYRTRYIATLERGYRKEFEANQVEFQKVFSARNKTIKSMIDGMSTVLDLGNLDSANTVDELPNQKDFVTNAGVQTIINNPTHMSEIEQHKTTIDKLYKIYSGLRSATSYLENTKAIITKLRFMVDMERRDNPLPPGITPADEHANAVAYIKKNLIIF
jgi:DNA polymerase elongation subunit (family B)